MARIKIVPIKNRDVNKTPIKNTKKKKVVKKKTLKNPSKKDQMVPKTKTKRKPKITKKTVILPVDENYTTIKHDINRVTAIEGDKETQNWRTIALRSLEKIEQLKDKIETLRELLL